MRTFKAIYGVIGAVIPVLYCGYLLFYFLNLSGSVEQAQANGLGPTVLGLGAVAVLFSVPLVLRLLRLVTALHPPRGPDASPPDDDFDADAAIARYKARQAKEAAPVAPIREAPRPPSAQRPSFGRRG